MESPPRYLLQQTSRYPEVAIGDYDVATWPIFLTYSTSGIPKKSPTLPEGRNPFLS